MAWFDKRKHSPSVSGDGIKRKRAKRKDALLLSEYKDKAIREEQEKALLIIQNRPDTFFTVLYVLLVALGAVLSFSAGSAYASEAYGSGFYFVLNHIKHLVAGFVISSFFYFASQPRFMRIISFGFYGASIRGSENNDPFCIDNDTIRTITNHSGGILGGITNGMPLIFDTAIKPTPSIAKAQKSVLLDRMQESTLQIKGRHDPCIVPRAVPVIEAAAAVAIFDCWLGILGGNNHGYDIFQKRN